MNSGSSSGASGSSRVGLMSRSAPTAAPTAASRARPSLSGASSVAWTSSRRIVDATGHVAEEPVDVLDLRDGQLGGPHHVVGCSAEIEKQRPDLNVERGPQVLHLPGQAHRHDHQPDLDRRHRERGDRDDAEQHVRRRAHALSFSRASR